MFQRSSDRNEVTTAFKDRDTSNEQNNSRRFGNLEFRARFLSRNTVPCSPHVHVVVEKNDLLWSYSDLSNIEVRHCHGPCDEPVRECDVDAEKPAPDGLTDPRFQAPARQPSIALAARPVIDTYTQNPTADPQNERGRRGDSDEELLASLSSHSMGKPQKLYRSPKMAATSLSVNAMGGLDRRLAAPALDDHVQLAPLTQLVQKPRQMSHMRRVVNGTIRHYITNGRTAPRRRRCCGPNRRRGWIHLNYLQRAQRAS
jgi:hypothetical protein